MLKRIIPILILFLLNYSLFAQQINQTVFFVKISEINFLNPNRYVFLLENSWLEISKRKITQSNNKNIFKVKLSQTNQDSIQMILEKIVFMQNDSLVTYSKAAMDGVQWDVLIDYKIKKHIVIENDYVEQIQLLFTYINKIIPKGKPKIDLMIKYY
jgi:hypothetical protein